MRVLYVAMRHDYGDPARGLSFEETNFRSALEGMGHEVVHFDFMDEARRHGVARMRRNLIECAAHHRPDVAFLCLFTDQIDVETLQRLKLAGGCPTVNWFADDHWRFDSFSRHIAPALDLAVTTDSDSVPKYRALPGVRVLLSQWACNRYAYDRTSSCVRHEVTFVGQPHGDRRHTIDRIRAAGYTVDCWGHGWSAGRLDHKQMVDVFSTSRVNLNLSNSSESPGLRSRISRVLRLSQPVARPPQIKGRNFEVPGCGGFLLTERVPYLERYFELDREVAVYNGVGDLADKLAYWYSEESERSKVAEAGYRRVQRDHTYDHRFADIFAEMGLDSMADRPTSLRP